MSKRPRAKARPARATVMTSVATPRPVAINTAKLWRETLAAFANGRVLKELDGNLIFVFDGAAPSQAAVDALVAAHNPAPDPPTPAETQAAQDLANCKAFMQSVNGSATNAQRDAVIKAFMRLVRREIAE